ncbi:MAG: uracil-DNA glycosylase [Firmicutes bacterium]|nr:uracil-DNA glycosylase [Bacillota bacterium]
MPSDTEPTAEWDQLTRTIHACVRCPRLHAFRERVGEEKVRRHAEEDYWSRPVAGFGDPDARLIIIGLAPGAHGANRTGRVFTGDASGEWLYGTLHALGYASQPTARHRDDGLTLRDAYIANIVRCVPPDNRPTSAEITACAPYLAAEMSLLKNARVYLALGGLAFAQTLRFMQAQGLTTADRLKFRHGLEHPLTDGRQLLASYHPSQQNTRTGRLTMPMWEAVFARAKALTDTSEPHVGTPSAGDSQKS